jgi:hypothetical protein
MADVVHVGGISVLYDEGVAADRTIYVKPSDTGGSVYTYRAYGTAGQTVEIRGGFTGDAWAAMQQIAVLTVGGTQSAVVQHTWPVLAVQGVAQVKIARGNA